MVYIFCSCQAKLLSLDSYSVNTNPETKILDENFSVNTIIENNNFVLIKMYVLLLAVTLWTKFYTKVYLTVAITDFFYM